jgi:uncharacterized protein (DUF58 family)
LPEPTLPGRVTIVFLFVGLWFPLLEHHNPLLFVVCTLLATVMASVAVTHLATGDLTSERSMPRRVVAGEPFQVQLIVKNVSRWRPAFRLRFRDALQSTEPGELTCGPGVPILVPGGRVVITYTRRLQRRGVFPVSNSLAATRFPFGIFEKRRLLKSSGPERIVVLPSLGRLGRDARQDLSRGYRARATTAHSREGHDEFHSIREYRPGDNPRHIHWKTSARAMTLMRRVMRTEGGEDLLVFLDTNVAGLDGDVRRRSVERAISCAATLLADAAKQGRRIRIRFPGGLATHRGTRRGLISAWETLARIRPGQRGIESIVDEERAVGSAALVLSLHGDAGAASARLAARGCRAHVWDASHADFGRYFIRRTAP